MGRGRHYDRLSRSPGNLAAQPAYYVLSLTQRAQRKDSSSLLCALCVLCVRLLATSIQLLDIDVAELHQSRWPGPFTGCLVIAAMMLQRQRTGCRHARQFGVGDDFLAVQLDPETVAFHGDFKGVPFDARLVHAY